MTTVIQGAHTGIQCRSRSCNWCPAALNMSSTGGKGNGPPPRPSCPPTATQTSRLEGGHAHSEEAMVDTVHRSRFAECPSFNGTTELPRKCNVAFS